MSSDVCQNEQKWLGRLPVSGGLISECSRGVNARGCGPELSGGTIQTSKTHFLQCKQVSPEVSRQLRLLRYQATLSSRLLRKRTPGDFLALRGFAHATTLFTIKREIPIFCICESSALSEQQLP